MWFSGLCWVESGKSFPAYDFFHWSAAIFRSNAFRRKLLAGKLGSAVDGGAFTLGGKSQKEFYTGRLGTAARDAAVVKIIA